MQIWEIWYQSLEVEPANFNGPNQIIVTGEVPCEKAADIVKQKGARAVML